MSKHFARSIAGMLSISLLTAAVVTVSSAAAQEPTVPTVTQSQAQTRVAKMPDPQSIVTPKPQEKDAPLTGKAGVTPRSLPILMRVNTPDDERGYEKSAYRGKWYDPRYESIRKCIGTRESHFTYMMSNGGAYQFMSYDRWPISLAWMMKKETRKEYGKAAANRMWRVLSKTEVNKWSRYWQDFAFWVVWRHGAGKHHWNEIVPGTGCF